MSAPPALTQVQLWQVSRQGQDVIAQKALLAPQELAHLETLREGPARDRHVLSRAALRVLLSRLTPSVAPADWRLSRAANGRPEVVGPIEAGTISFNIAHTDDEIILALSAGACVGVDIEALQRKSAALALARRHFRSEEVASLEALPAPLQQRRFLELWTLKEARVKVTGEGLARGLPEAGFVLDEDGGIALLSQHQESADLWQFGQWSLADTHLVALALRGRNGPLEVQWGCLQNLQPVAMANEPALLRASAVHQARMYSSTNLEP